MVDRGVEGVIRELLSCAGDDGGTPGTASIATLVPVP
jgi:hypothetical protein